MTVQAPLVHAGFTFPGIEQGLVFGTPEPRNQKNEVFGLKGATVIDGGYSTREITCEMWLFDDYSTTGQFNAKLRAITEHVNVTGTLVDSMGSTFEDVQFLRQEPVGKLLYSNELKWWKHIRLIFEELSP